MRSRAPEPADAPGVLALITARDGARLLSWIETHERERACPWHRQRIAAGNAGARELLEGAGCRMQRSYRRMVLGLSGGVERVASDNPAALALYERIGMTTRFRLDAYERLAAPPPQNR